MFIKNIVGILIISAVIGLSAGLWAKFISTPWYSSNALVETTEREYESSISQLISSANPLSFGAALSSSIAYNPASSLKRQITTRSFVEKLDPDQEFLKRLFPSSWNKDDNLWIDKKTAEDLRVFLVFNLFMDYDITTELIECSLLTTNKNLSQDLLSSIINLLNSSAKDRVLFESSQLIDLASEYLEKDRAIFSKEIFSGIIQSETRKKLVAETRTNLLVRLIDKPSLPTVKSKPRGSSYAMIGATLSFFFLIIFRFRKDLYNFLSSDLKKILKS